MSEGVRVGQRSRTCGELKAGEEGRPVVLTGWVHRRRDHGNLIFIDLRDRYGITQLTSQVHAGARSTQQLCFSMRTPSQPLISKVPAM